MTSAQGWTERRPLLSFQLVIWSILVPFTGLPLVVESRVDASSLAPAMVAWAVAGIITTTLVGSGWLAIWERLPRSGWLLLLLIPSSLLAAALWVLPTFFIPGILVIEPVTPDLRRVDPHLVAFVRSTLTMTMWNALFFAFQSTRRARLEREHALAAKSTAHLAQLQLLKSQLHPHFLFNALNSVVGLISENPAGAQTMVRNLATLLRLSLDTDATVTSLRAELEFVKLYLACEQVRFEERLVVTFDVQPGLDDVEVPPMLLQPLVENAVKYGLSPDGKTHVTIRAARANGVFTFEVVNDGSLSASTAFTGPAGAGIGVRNVKERLSYLFPGRESFSLRESNGKVHAAVTIPAKA